jgi:hypothetical protein
MIYIIGKKRMTLLNKIVSSSLKENKINRRLDDYAYKANIEAKRIKSDVRKPKESIQGKPSSLLNKIVQSSINENKAEQRLQQIAYSAINGQRQQEYQTPEGITMLGQMGREKPLSAITKEMIKEYQEQEQQPFMIDGEARKYMSADYQPLMQLPVDITDIKDDLRALYKNKVATVKTIKDAEDNIKALDDYYKAFIRDINIYGMNAAKKAEKEKLEADKIGLKMEYDKLRNDLDKYDYEIKELMRVGKEINRENALIPAKNREEVMKYEQSLMQLNRNRLNIQKQPYESDMEYYKRLREIETQKANPELYQKFALNKTTSELKTKMKNLFNNDSQIEDIIKSLTDNDKFLVNKNFDAIEADFVKKNGFNPSMNTKMAVKEITSFFESPASKLQALIKRKNIQDLYIPDLSKKREEDALAQQQDAVNKLKAVFKRKKIEPKFSNVLNKYRDMEAQERLKAEKGYLDERDIAVLQEQAREEVKRLKLNRTREQQQARMTELAEQKNREKEASKTIQNAFRNKKAINTFANRVVEKAIDDKKKEAINKIKGYIKAKEPRDIYSYALENTVRPTAKLQAYMRANQPQIQNIQETLKDVVGEKRRLDRINADIRKVEEEQNKLFNSTDIIKQSLKDTKNKSQIMEAVRQAIADRQKPIYVSSPGSLALSAATTIAEQEQARLRKPRSDIGEQRGPYNTKKKQKRERRELLKSLKPEERRLIIEQERAQEQSRTRSQARENIINSVFQRPGMKNLQNIARELQDIEEDEPMAKTSAKKGKGLKPPKRQVRTNKEELMKNRLRLVISQIEAGNTNPRLIVELNKLYKTLYDIDNAIMLLKK